MKNESINVAIPIGDKMGKLVKLLKAESIMYRIGLRR